VAGLCDVFSENLLRQPGHLHVEVLHAGAQVEPSVAQHVTWNEIFEEIEAVLVDQDLIGLGDDASPPEVVKGNLPLLVGVHAHP